MSSMVVSRHLPTNFGGGVFGSALGLTIPDDLSVERWQELGAHLSQQGNKMAWWIADWARHGKWKHGEHYETVIAATGLDYGTVANYATVAGKFESSRRRENLTFGHHAAVAGFKTKGEQEAWLDMAEEQALSVMALRDEVRGQKQGTDTDERFGLAHVSRFFGLSEVEKKNWEQAAESRGIKVGEWLRQVANEAALREAA